MGFDLKRQRRKKQIWSETPQIYEETKLQETCLLLQPLKNKSEFLKAIIFTFYYKKNIYTDTAKDM